MCGIIAAFGLNQTEKIRNQVLKMSRKIRYKRPELRNSMTNMKRI